MNPTLVFVGYATLLVAALLAPYLDAAWTRIATIVVALALAVWTVVAVFEVAD